MGNTTNLGRNEQLHENRGSPVKNNHTFTCAQIRNSPLSFSSNAGFTCVADLNTGFQLVSFHALMSLNLQASFRPSSAERGGCSNLKDGSWPECLGGKY